MPVECTCLSDLLEQWSPHFFITHCMDKLFFEHTCEYIFINYIFVLLDQYAKKKKKTFKKKSEKMSKSSDISFVGPSL